MSALAALWNASEYFDSHDREIVPHRRLPRKISSGASQRVKDKVGGFVSITPYFADNTLQAKHLSVRIDQLREAISKQDYQVSRAQLNGIALAIGDMFQHTESKVTRVEKGGNFAIRAHEETGGMSTAQVPKRAVLSVDLRCQQSNKSIIRRALGQYGVGSHDDVTQIVMDFDEGSQAGAQQRH